MLLPYEAIPKISKTASVKEVFDVFSNLNIPNTFQFEIVDNRLVLQSLRNELGQIEIVFPESLFCINTKFPAFVFCTPNEAIKRDQFLTHWSLLYFLLESRLKVLASYDKVYSGLIQQDIVKINNYVIYTPGNAYNTKVKNNNIVVMLDPYKNDFEGYAQSYTYRSNKPAGDWLFNSRPSEYTRKAQIDKMNTVPGSETMLSESEKIVYDIHSSEYKAPGFQILRDGNNTLGFKTIFPPKQNVPSRLKTHLHGEAFDYVKPNDAIYIQDAIFSDDVEWVTKDNTLKDMIVLFEEIEEKSYRFGAGEIEVSKKFGNETVLMHRHIECQLDQVFVKEGCTYKSSNGDIKLGRVLDQDLTVRIHNVDKIHVKSIIESGVNNAYRIEYIAYNKATNSRITSQTGFKGLTKVMENMGHIHYWNNAKTKVDAACSINSLKGKMNTIILAQAALAVKLGTYKPKHPSGLLDSLDEEEINEAAQSLPVFKYVNGDKVIEGAKVGLIQASVTELGSMFSKVRPQILSFNAVKFLEQQEESSLASYIRDNYINEDKKEVVMELGKVIQDQYGLLLEEEELPIYKIAEIKTVYDMEDLILQKRSILPIDSKLLDEEYNTGFYISCAPISDEYIRIPSAKVLNNFWSKLESNGEYVYQDILVNISKILLHAIEGRPHFITIHRNKPRDSYMTARKAYINCCNTALFSGSLQGQQLIKTLLAPELPGINLKQIPDRHVPSGVVVVLDYKVYNSMHKIAYGEDAEIYREQSFKCFAMRNPNLWRTQNLIEDVWNEEMFREHLEKVHEIDLDKYLAKDMNKYCVLVSKQLISHHHSDADGDLLTLSLPEGIAGQILLSEFKMKGVTKEELKWDEDYIKSEVSSNEDFDWNKRYQVYTIYNKTPKGVHNGYNQFLCNAAKAKSGIGSGTNDTWCFYMILQLYQGILENDPEKAAMPFKDHPQPVKLTKEMAEQYDHYYTRLLEDKVSKIAHLF